MKKIAVLLLLFGLTSCLGWGDMFATNSWEDGPYYVTDEAAGCPSLYIEINSGAGHGRVSCLTAIGSNQTHIIAKTSEGMTQYWILDKRKDRPALNSDEIVEGPYSYNEFVNRKKKLKIKQLKFTHRWKKN